MRVITTLILLTFAAGAAAEQFWIEYDASCGQFPEECGWTRTTHGGGAVRSLADGVLTLDSMASPLISDYYKIERPITPGPGEMFVATWRMCVAQESGFWEWLAAVKADDGYLVMLAYKTDQMWSLDEQWYYPIAPGAFHTYRLESADLDTYSLWIDECCVHTGVFGGPFEPIPHVDFGDLGYGSNTLSLTQWSYWGFGIVPEPGAMALLLACACLGFRWERSWRFVKGDLQ
jgi:hypothetical protein